VEGYRALLGDAELLDGGLDFGDGAHATESAKCVPVGKAGDEMESETETRRSRAPVIQSIQTLTLRCEGPNQGSKVLQGSDFLALRSFAVFASKI
jgi:hypothetical protein